MFQTNFVAVKMINTYLVAALSGRSKRLIIPFCHKYAHRILSQNNFVIIFVVINMYRDNSGFTVGPVRVLVNVQTMLKMPKSSITFMIVKISH